MLVVCGRTADVNIAIRYGVSVGGCFMGDREFSANKLANLLWGLMVALS